MLTFLYNIWFHMIILTVLRIFAPNLARALGDRLVDLKLWVSSLAYSVALTSIGYVYAVRFVVITTLRFMARPRIKFLVPERRSIAPAILQREEYGIHRRVDLGNIVLHYVESGERDAPVLLFLHGIFDFWFGWRHQVAEFSQDYRVILLDLRGCGDSGKPANWPDYSVDVVAEDIRRLVHHHLRVEKVSLVGHGWGSVVGWTFLSRNPDMVDHYVFMTTPAVDVIRHELFHSWQYFRSSWYMFFYQVRVAPEWSVMLNDFEYLDRTVGQYATREELYAYKYIFSRRGALRSAVNHYRAMSKVFEDGLPVTRGESHGLYLQAQNDPLKSPNSEDYIRKLYPFVRVEQMPGVGHFLHQERPDLINARIRNFLDNRWYND